MTCRFLMCLMRGITESSYKWSLEGLYKRYSRQQTQFHSNEISESFVQFHKRHTHLCPVFIT